jgi:hypothetical protein
VGNHRLNVARGPAAPPSGQAQSCEAEQHHGPRRGFRNDRRRANLQREAVRNHLARIEADRLTDAKGREARFKAALAAVE